MYEWTIGSIASVIIVISLCIAGVKCVTIAENSYQECVKATQKPLECRIKGSN